MNAVIAVPVVAVWNDPARSATDVPVIVTNAGAEADPVCADAASRATLVPVAVRNTGADVGVAVNAETAVLAVAKVEAAERLAELTFVTADAVVELAAGAP